MCMDEFVKRLYDFMGIYKIFWSQNSHYRYFSDILPIFTDIYRYFFRNSSTCACEIKVRLFFSKNRRKIADFFILSAIYRCFFQPKRACEARAPQSRFFSGKIGIFRFFADFLTSDYLLQKSFPCRPKTDFSVIFRPKNPIFLSLGVTHGL